MKLLNYSEYPEGMLLQCHKELDGNKAVGVDEITKKEYERNLEQNIDGLVEMLWRIFN